MAGHSKYANIKHRKALQDSKRTKYFTKTIKNVFVAAKLYGPDILSNPSLRLAISKAKYYNVPKDKIERAIKNATEESNTENYSDIVYEGYGPGGVAFVVTALTDNKNRTASEVRSVFSKFHGNLGVDGSVSHMFDVVGCIKYKNVDFDKLFESAIDNDAIDVVKLDDFCEVLCNQKDLSKVRNALCDVFGDPDECGIEWRPNIFSEVSEEVADSVVRATGSIGREVCKVLSERNININDVVAISSDSGAGKKISFGDEVLISKKISDYGFNEISVAIFATKASVVENFGVDIAQLGCVV
uniref:Uncharacterized protein n=1 Tax=Biomphalaria glabrata TaxID=6526 RepID=A0A2C9JLT4_BIOGL